MLKGPHMEKGIDFIGVSAGAMILDDQGRVFLSKRGKKSRSEHGCWETPGGAVEFGETLEQTVRREMMEEFGIELEILAQLPAFDHRIPEERQHWVATTFLAKLAPGNVPRIMEPEKCDAIGWFALEALPHPLSRVTLSDITMYKKWRTNQ